MFTGFAMMMISGVMLFAGFATAAYENVYFRIKVAAMVLAAVNAFVYHRFTERRIVEWDAGAPDFSEAAARMRTHPALAGAETVRIEPYDPAVHGPSHPYDPDFERQMAAARKIMKKRRNVLRELAK